MTDQTTSRETAPGSEQGPGRRRITAEGIRAWLAAPVTLSAPGWAFAAAGAAALLLVLVALD